MLPLLKLNRKLLGLWLSVFLLSSIIFFFLSEKSIRWLNSDAFYYYVIGWNSSGFTLSYDSIYATTGIHPLWQIIILILNVFLWNSSDLYLAIVLGLCTTFLIIALFNLWTIVKMYNKHAWFIVLFPSYWLVFGLLSDAQYGNLFTYINGMESALSLFLLIYTIKILVHATNQGYNRFSIRLGVFSFLTVLSRLDLLPVVCILLLLPFYKSRIKPRVLFLQLIFPFSAMGLFLLYSRLSGGSFLPSSWIIKLGTSANLDWNLKNLGEILLGPKTVAYGGTLLSRHFQVLIPIVVFLIFTFSRFFANRVSRRSTLKVTWAELVFFVGLGISARGFIIYRQENIWNQGNWYFFDGVIYVQVLLNICLYLVLKRLIKVKLSVLLVVLVVVSNLFFLSTRSNSSFNQEYLDVWSSREAICTSLEALTLKDCSSISFAEFDDGIVAYALRGKNFNALGLAVDTKAAWEIKNGNLAKLLDSRCYFYYASVNYQELDSGILTNIARPGDEILNLDGLWVLVRNKASLPSFCT